jgi:DNA-binding MarR family transcriptional regulator
MSPESAEEVRRRRRLTAEVKDSLRALSNQLSLLNHQVGAQLDLKDVDIECLELITRHGPMSPTALSKRTGLHPATITGILDRLQRGGWATRERDPDATDRRAVTVRALRDRNKEMFQLYSGMNDTMDKLCSGYAENELELLAEFLRSTTDAGRDATTELVN